MIRGRVVMMLLVLNDGVYSGDRMCITCTKNLNLLLEMFKDDSLDGHCCDGYCTAAKKTSDKTQDATSESAEKVASAAWLIAPFQLGLEDCTMTFLVALEFLELRDQLRCCETSHENLACVDVYGTVLASVIDFHDAATQFLSRNLETHLTHAA